MNDFRPTVRPLAGASPEHIGDFRNSWHSVKRICLALLPLLLAACDLTVVGDQDFSSLQGKLEKAVASIRPNAKLTKEVLKEKQVFYKWDSGKDGGRIFLFHAASEQEAAEKMESSIFRISVGPDAELKHLGDKAYIWIGPTSGRAIIRFRKSNVYVDLSAPTEMMAKELAKRIADLIPDQ